MSVRPPSRIRRPPVYDPPFDDELPAGVWAGPLQPTLPLGPLGDGAPAGPAASGHPGGYPAGRARPAVPAGRARPAAGRPAEAATRALVARFVTGCLEVLNGLRPAHHLRAVTSPLEAGRVLAAMNLAGRRLRRAVPPRTDGRPEELIKLRRLRTDQPRPDAIEVAAVIGAGDRTWAATFRLERQAGRWLCTAAEIL